MIRRKKQSLRAPLILRNKVTRLDSHFLFWPIFQTSSISKLYRSYIEVKFFFPNKSFFIKIVRKITQPSDSVIEFTVKKQPIIAVNSFCFLVLEAITFYIKIILHFQNSNEIIFFRKYLATGLKCRLFYQIFIWFKNLQVVQKDQLVRLKWLLIYVTLYKLNQSNQN